MNENVARFLMDMLLHLEANEFISIIDKEGTLNRLLDLEKFTFLNFDLLKSIINED